MSTPIRLQTSDCTPESTSFCFFSINTDLQNFKLHFHYPYRDFFFYMLFGDIEYDIIYCYLLCLYVFLKYLN